MEYNTYDDDDEFKIDNHDDHLNSLDDLIASNLQESDSFGDPQTYSRKRPRFNLVTRGFVQVMDCNHRGYNIL